MSVQIERYDLLRDRLRAWRGEILPADRSAAIAENLPADGKRFRFFLRTVIAVISALSGALLFGFLHAISFPAPELFGAFTAVAASVWARRSLGWRHTGAEEGWMLAGSWLFVFALPEGMVMTESIWFWLAGATLLAGLIVRAPLFLGCAVLLISAGIGFAWGDPEVLWVALLGALVIALVRRRRFRSPLIEIGLSWIEIACAIVAASQMVDDSIILAALTSFAMLAIGILARDGITLWSSLAFVAVAVYEAGELLPLRNEWKLMLAGALVFTVSVALERLLRVPLRGWTSRSAGSGESDLLEIAGAVAITPTHGAAPRDQGGEFGGGGATERW